MKKISGIIVMIILIIAIVFGLGYKLASPDGWDRFVGTITGTEPTPTPTATPAPLPVPSKKPSENHQIVEPETPHTPVLPSPSPSISPSPSPSPSASPSPSPSISPAPTEKPIEELGYEEYMDMSGAQQQEIFEKFESPDEFFEWYNAAKEKYDEENKGIIVDGGEIDLEDYLKDDSNS